MEYLIFIVLIIILVIVWSTSLELDCIHTLLKKGGLSSQEEKSLAQQLDKAGNELQKSVDEAQKP